MVLCWQPSPAQDFSLDATPTTISGEESHRGQGELADLSPDSFSLSRARRALRGRGRAPFREEGMQKSVFFKIGDEGEIGANSFEIFLANPLLHSAIMYRIQSIVSKFTSLN